MIKNFTLCMLLLTALVSAEDKKKALIFGITGQDGAYLTELLLEKGYEVHGVKRPASTLNTSRIDRFYKDLHENGVKMILHYGDILDASRVFNLVNMIQPDEIYNLAAQSHVGISFSLPDYTSQVNALGTLRILSAIKDLGLQSKIRYYQASTSELYGLAQEIPQSETTKFYPRSPYAAAKLFAYWITVNYREAHGLFACNGILFNHESPFRGATFVTKKITQAVAKIHYGLQDVLYLGNLEAKRDWGYAKDYVEAMWMMLQQEKPSDYVIATGENHSVREFVELAFQEIGTEIVWEGEGVDEVGIDNKTKKIIVKIDPKYFRPSEVDLLLGNPTKAKLELGWSPKTSFKELVKLMVQSDLNEAKITCDNTN